MPNQRSKEVPFRLRPPSSQMWTTEPYDGCDCLSAEVRAEYKRYFSAIMDSGRPIRQIRIQVGYVPEGDR